MNRRDFVLGGTAAGVVAATGIKPTHASFRLQPGKTKNLTGDLIANAAEELHAMRATPTEISRKECPSLALFTYVWTELMRKEPLQGVRWLGRLVQRSWEMLPHPVKPTPEEKICNAVPVPGFDWVPMDTLLTGKYLRDVDEIADYGWLGHTLLQMQADMYHELRFKLHCAAKNFLPDSHRGYPVFADYQRTSLFIFLRREAFELEMFCWMRASAWLASPVPAFEDAGLVDPVPVHVVSVPFGCLPMNKWKHEPTAAQFEQMPFLVSNISEDVEELRLDPVQH